MAIIVPLVLVVTGIGLTISSHADATAQLTLTPSTSSVTKGSNIVVTVVLNSGSSGNSVGTVQSALNYSSNLTYVSASASGPFSQASLSPMSGVVDFTMYNTSGVSGTNNVATLTFQANSTGTATLSLANVAASGDHSAGKSDAYDITSLNNDLGSVSGTDSYTITAPAVVTPPSGGGGTTGTTGTGTSKTSTSTSKSSSTSTTAKGATTTTTSTTTLPSPSAAPTNPVPVITNVSASDLKGTSATITWQTNIPSTSVVNYGLGSTFGATAESKNLTTNHSVTLSSTFLKPETIYYYEVLSAASSGASSTSPSSQFTTTGLPVTIKVVNKSGDVISGALVKIDGSSAKTNSSGEATFSNVRPGLDSVQIIYGTKTITLSTNVGKYNPKNNSYQNEITLTAALTPSNKAGLVVVIILLLVLLAVFGYHFMFPNKFNNLNMFNKFSRASNAPNPDIVTYDIHDTKPNPVVQPTVAPKPEPVQPEQVAQPKADNSTPAAPEVKPNEPSQTEPGSVIHPDKKE
jgi:hypothetical protein